MAGRPPDVTDEEILAAIKRIFGPATASEVGEEVGMKRSGVNKRLDDLVERGLIHEKQAGAKAKVYWLTDEGKRQLHATSAD